MKVHLLALHRKERYDGEFAPEVVAVCDEWTMDENPSWWPEEIQRQQDAVGNDAVAWAQVTIDLPVNDLLSALYPNPQVHAIITATEPVVREREPAEADCRTQAGEDRG